MRTRPLRLLSIGHSYCVALNRRLAHEVARAGGADWEVTAVAPARFLGDLRPVICERFDGEISRLETIPAYLTSRIHLFVYGLRLRELSRRSCDLVHCWEEPYIMAGGQAAWWTPRNVPLVFWTMQNLAKRYPPPFSMIEKYCFERCAGWMGSGRLVVDAMRERGHGDKPHTVMPIGIDAEQFRPDAAAREATRVRLDWSRTSPPVIGFVGRFVEGKGLILMTEVLDRLELPWRALFLGGGPMEATLRVWAARYGDRVRILTDVTHDQVPPYLNAIDGLCAPSQTTAHWREQFGRMVVEAFACGVPVISSDSGELPYVVGDAAIVVPERDEDGWVAALRGLIDDPAGRSEWAMRGRDHALANYAWPVVARRHLDFFSELIEQGAPHN
jgi:phosphatidyl-myo-inositol dimannoside synthase